MNFLRDIHDNVYLANSDKSCDSQNFVATVLAYVATEIMWLNTTAIRDMRGGSNIVLRNFTVGLMYLRDSAKESNKDKHLLMHEKPSEIFFWRWNAKKCTLRRSNWSQFKTSVVNFTNILCAVFSYKCFAGSFFVLAF